MNEWIGNIEETTVENEDFRRVLFTGSYMQLTVMRLKPGEEIGWEVHDDHDQFLRIEQGEGELELGDEEGGERRTNPIRDDWAFVVPAGLWHNVVNSGTTDLKLYSLYAPSEHAPGTVHATKAEADAAEH